MMLRKIFYILICINMSTIFIDDTNANTKLTKPIIERVIPAEWVEKEIDEIRFFEYFRIQTDNCEIIIDLDLSGKISNANGKISKKCDTIITKENHIQAQKGARVWLRMHYLFYEKDLILVYDTQHDKEDWGGGMISRIDINSLKTKWSREIYGFNTSPCLREGNYIYITASNFIAKLDLQNGKYKWRHKLNEKIFYDQFEDIEINGDYVIFKFYGIKVNKTTGKIIEK